MEHCTKGFGAISQLLSDASMDWHISQSSLEWNEVICPQPIRATRNAYLCDGGTRFHCKPLSLNNVHSRHSEVDILDFLLNQDDQDWDSSNFLSISPPVRSSNPITRDSAFGKLPAPSLSPLGGSLCGGKQSPRVERAGSPCGSSSSFSGKPMIRIEGFSSGKSDSRCVVSALA